MKGKYEGGKTVLIALLTEKSIKTDFFCTKIMNVRVLVINMNGRSATPKPSG